MAESPLMVKIEFQGGAELARKLDALAEELSAKVVGAALVAGAQPIRNRAEQLMKRGADAPHAQEHVRVTLGKSGHSIAIGPTKSFFYWLFQEFGTVHHGAQPAMRPAFDERGSEALGIIGQRLWAAVRAKAGGELAAQQAFAPKSGSSRSDTPHESEFL
jgi:HK97 gp10 family phage protein